jgi:hypothetical protein
MPITTSDIIAIDSSDLRLDSPKIKAVLSFDTEAATLRVELVPYNTTTNNIERSIYLETDSTALTGFEANFATHYATVKTAVDEMMKDYLENLAANSGATFTIV